MSLNTRTEPMENRRLSLIVEVDQERVDQELRKAARKVGGEYRIPGFRKGKAPYSVVVQYVGLPNLYSEFVDTLGNEIYTQAVEQEEIEPYAMASLDISSLEPLTYNYEIPLEPTVELGDYRSIRMDETEPEVTDEEIDEVLQELRSSRAGWTDVDRASEYGDMLTIDVKSVLAAEAGDEEGDETVVLEEEDWDVTLDEENPMEPAGLDEELLGMSPGEEKDFELGWPEDSQSMYAGKRAKFHVKLHKIQANLEPELDDAFAQSVDEEMETLEDLRKGHPRNAARAQEGAGGERLPGGRTRQAGGASGAGLPARSRGRPDRLHGFRVRAATAHVWHRRSGHVPTADWAVRAGIPRHAA